MKITSPSTSILATFALATFILTTFASADFAAAEMAPAPNKCECQFTAKDYDPAKGFYFDKVTYFPLPRVNGRFGCIYKCQDRRGHYVSITHVHQESYFGTPNLSVTNAKKMVCPQSISEFVPKYDLIGHIQYYDTVPAGNFSSAMSPIPAIRNWSKRQGCD